MSQQTKKSNFHSHVRAAAAALIQYGRTAHEIHELLPHLMAWTEGMGYVWDSPDIAAQAAGGICADGFTSWEKWKGMYQSQASIVWDEEGSNGGVGGGLRGFIDSQGREFWTYF